MSSKPRESQRGSGVENRLLDLLEYRNVHGAVIATLDGLIVANAATTVPDAEQLAATTVSMEPAGDGEPGYWDIESEHGAIRVVSGNDLRLIVLSDASIDADRLRSVLIDHLLDIEHMIRL